MKILKKINLKYLIINIIGIMIYIGIISVYNNQRVIIHTAEVTLQQNKLTTVGQPISILQYISGILIYIFPVFFFGIAAVISTIKTKGKNKYAITTFMMSIVIAILMLILILIPDKTEKSNPIISEGTLWLLLAIFTFLIRKYSNDIYKDNILDNK